MKENFSLKTIYFYITGGCNLKCRHCWITPDSVKDDMTISEIKGVIEQAKEMGVRHIKITGGEPFLRKDIFEILHFIIEKGMEITIETNGTFIRDREAQELKELKVSHISVSMDSFEPGIHDDFRGLRGSFNMAVDGVKTLCRAGFRPQVIASIHKKNMHSVEKLTLFVESLGAGSLKLNTIASIGRGARMERDGELISVEDSLRLEKSIDTEIQPKVNIPIFLDIPIAFKKISYIRKNRSSCGILTMIGILSDGSVSMCGIGCEIKELIMGNIKNDRLKDIWERSDILFSIREGIPDKLEGICSRCIFKRLCLGKCRASSYHKENSLTAPFYFCQEAFDKGLFPKARIFN